MTSRLPGALVAAAIALGCGPASPPPAAPTAPPRGDQLFARGDFSAAAEVYERQLTEAPASERVLEARFFLTLVRIKEGEKLHVLEELQALAHDGPRTVWGRVAGVLANEMTRSQILHEALMAAGADVQRAGLRARTLALEIDALEAQLADQQEALGSAQSQRARLQSQLKEAEDDRALLADRIRELEDELDALKQIDMQRQP